MHLESWVTYNSTGIEIKRTLYCSVNSVCEAPSDPWVAQDTCEQPVPISVFIPRLERIHAFVISGILSRGLSRG